MPQRTPAPQPDVAPLIPPWPPTPAVQVNCDCCPDLGRALAEMMAQMSQRMPHRDFSVTLRIDVCKGRDDWDPPINANGMALGEFTSTWHSIAEGWSTSRDGYVFVAHNGSFAPTSGPQGYLYSINTNTATAFNHTAPSLSLPSSLPGSGGPNAATGTYSHLTVFQVKANQVVPAPWLTSLSSQTASCRVWAQ